MKKSQFILKNIKNNKKSYILPFVITASISFIISLILIVTISSIRFEFEYSDKTFGKYDAEIFNLSEDKIENLQNHISIGKFGEVFDTNESTAIFSERGYLKHYDKNAADMTGVEIVSGKYPTAENEIAVEKNSEFMIKKYSVGSNSGYPYSIKIPITDKNGKVEDRVFEVTGVVKEKYENENWEKNIYVSKKYADKVGYKKSEIIKLKGIENYNVRKIEKSLDKIISDVGIDIDSVRMVSAINYMKNTVLDSFYAVAIIVFGLILVSYVILKNINTSKLYRDIKDMAILEAVGASYSQIKDIVITQSFVIYALSVALGLGINVILVIIVRIMNLFKSIPSSGTDMYTLLKDIAIYTRFIDIICIYIFIFLIVFLSYILSSMKTVKNMLKIDIHSAIKNPRVIYMKNKKNGRKSSIIIIFIIVSLCSVVLKSIENENKEAYFEDTDFIIRVIDLYSDTNNLQPLSQVFSKDNTIEDIEKDILKIDGVDKIEKSYVAPIRYNINKNDILTVDLYGISDEEIENLSKSAKYGELDVEAFKRGDGICVHSMYAKELEIEKGDNIDLVVLSEGKEVTRTFKVLNISQVSPDFGFIYSSMLDKGIGKNINNLKIECKDSKRKNVKSEIENIIDMKGTNLEFVDYVEEVDQTMTYLNAIKLLFGTICALAIILSIFNSINASIYEIMSQSADFGVLMAIGISDKQLEDIIFKKIEEKIIVPAIYGIVFGSLFVFIGSKIFSEISAINLDISAPWGLYLFIFITAYLSVKVGTKYVCNKMKKLSPTDIINNI